MSEKYDLIVIGGGGAGSGAANTANINGRRIALIERDYLGGTCLNYGCDPTKTMLHSAGLLHQARDASGVGLRIPTAEVDWQALQRWVKEVLRRMRGGTVQEARQNLRQKFDLYMEEARFVSPHEVQVGDKRLQADRFIIATGTKALIPPIKGLEESGFITNVEAVSLASLPNRLVIVGGGPIGVEFAQLFHRFGVEVTILQSDDYILPLDDRELAERLSALLKEEGIRIKTGVRASETACIKAGKSKRVTFVCDEGEESIEVDEVMLAAGRQAAIESLNLEAAGVETYSEGIVVDKTLRTNVPHIWAVGDVIGGPRFTHVAGEHAKIAAHNAFATELKSFDYSLIPWATYTEPALAHVGKTEEELREAGVSYRVGRVSLDELDRALTKGQTNGLIKILVDEAGQIVGGHVLAPNAGDLLAPIIIAMRAGMSAKRLANTILPYPTMAEGVRWAASQAVEG